MQQTYNIQQATHNAFNFTQQNREQQITCSTHTHSPPQGI